ncbi:MAG: gliding motility lipoprotein GldH [Flavobacteriales bacterium]|nr:gliding motility lipoprotein GldH [Flavobacteriales bacterium]
MRFLITIALLFQAISSFAVDFSKLSRTEPVTTSYPATLKCYVDVTLFLNTSQAFKGPVFLRVSYIIGLDTLTDNLTVDGSFNGVIKQLFLDEGERVTAIIHLNNGSKEEIEGIEGSLSIVRNPEFKPADTEGKNTFLSGIWKSDQTPLFRVAIQNSAPKTFRLKLSVNENYEFDKLHLKMKVISPSAGIVMIDKIISINDLPAVEMRKKTFTIDLEEIDLATAGTYYFQVMQNMAGMRLNGIDKIEYQIVPK